MASFIIDQREPSHVKSAILNKFGRGNVIGAGTHEKDHIILEAGDIQIATDDGYFVFVERKTPDDLLGSIKDGRIFEQVHKMREKSEWCYVVITGVLYPGHNGNISLANRETGWNFDSVQGALLSIQELGCGVIYTKNEFDYPDCIDRLAKRSRKELKVGSNRNSSILSVGEQLLLSLPGIGFDRLKKLLEFRPRPIDAFFYLLDRDRQTIPGISLATKYNIRKELGLKDEEIALLTSTLDFEFIDEKELIKT